MNEIESTTIYKKWQPTRGSSLYAALTDMLASEAASAEVANRSRSLAKQADDLKAKTRITWHTDPAKLSAARAELDAIEDVIAACESERRVRGHKTHTARKNVAATVKGIERKIGLFERGQMYEGEINKWNKSTLGRNYTS